jgi:hypothetical protein
MGDTARWARWALVGFLSRRESRTKPGVLTLGSDKNNARPERAEEDRSELPLNIRDYQPNMPIPAAPSGRNAFLGPIPGVKTPGLVLESLRDKSAPVALSADAPHADTPTPPPSS